MPSKGSARWLSQIAVRGDTLGSLPAPSAERRGGIIGVIRRGHFPAYLSQQAGETEVERFTPRRVRRRRDRAHGWLRVRSVGRRRLRGSHFRSSAPLSGPRSGSPVPWCTTSRRRGSDFGFAMSRAGIRHDRLFPQSPAGSHQSGDVQRRSRHCLPRRPHPAYPAVGLPILPNHSAGSWATRASPSDDLQSN